jgi:hypothetical protein
MLYALNDLATQISTGTQSTSAEAMNHFLNYCATNPDAELMYWASNMELKNDSDASYLVALEARSRAGGHTYFGKSAKTPYKSSMAPFTLSPKSSKTS